MDKHLLLWLKKDKKLLDYLKCQKEINNAFEKDLIYDLFRNFKDAFIELLYYFLEENGNLKNVFFQEIKKQGRRVYINYVPSAISHSFCWAHTPQGHNFWCDVHYKWAEYLGNNVIKPILKNSTHKYFYREFIDELIDGFEHE